MCPIHIVQHQLPAEQDDYDLRENAYKWRQLAMDMKEWMMRQEEGFIHIDDYMDMYKKLTRELKL